MSTREFNAGVTLRWTYIPSRVSRNTPIMEEKLKASNLRVIVLYQCTSLLKNSVRAQLKLKEIAVKRLQVVL